jgi:hypothetical protein
MTITGYDPKTFEIHCKIWKRQQLDAIQDVIDALRPRVEKRTKLTAAAIEVRHPALDSIDVHSAVVQGITPFVDDGSMHGAKVVVFRMQECAEPSKKNATKTVKGSGVSAHPELAKQAHHNSETVSPGEDANYKSPSPKAAPAGGLY